MVWSSGKFADTSSLYSVAWNGTRYVVVPANAAGTLWRNDRDEEPDLNLSGSCPGLLTLDVGDATATGMVALLAGSSPGSTVVPSGGCAGTEPGLENVSPLGSFGLDACIQKV